MNKITVITPTIGRRLWYIPSTQDRSGVYDSAIQASGSQPCDAGVVYVHGDRLVNLSITDHNGNVHKRTSVTLYQPGDNITHSDGGYAVWMDYQQQQAQPKPQASTTAKYFAFAHLPVHLQLVSKPLGQLADLLEQLLPNGPEKSAGMRKLLEAKDCFVRAALDVPPAELLAAAPITDADRLDLLLRSISDQFLTEPPQEVIADLDKHVGDGPLTAEKLIPVLDAYIQEERKPKQHTEDVDHYEG